MKAYRIKDWDRHFENNRTRELKRMDWVPVPNKHDGDGFTELLDHKNGMAHYGAWHLILQVASKCDPRGTLLRDGAAGGKIPHTEDTIARITRGSAGVIKDAIQRLLNIGWIEVYEDPAPSCDNPAPSCGSMTMEGKGTEGKGTEGKEKTVVALPFDSQSFVDTWAAWIEHRKKMHKPMSDYAQTLALAKLPKTEYEAVRWIENALMNGWQGIYEPSTEKTQYSKPSNRTPVTTYPHI